MIFHSVMPYESVFSRNVQNSQKPVPSDDMCERTMMVHSGVTMEVSLLADGRKRIERLYSTDPGFYLDKRFCVGTIIGEK